MPKEPGNNEFDVDNILNANNLPRRLLSDEGEIVDPLDQKLEKLTEQAGNKLKNYLVGYYNTNIFRSKLFDDRNIFLNQIKDLTEDRFTSYGSNGSDMEVRFRGAKIRLLGNLRKAVDWRGISLLGEDVKNMTNHCEEFRSGVVKHFRSTVGGASTQEQILYSYIATDSARSGTDLIIATLDVNLHESERDRLETIIYDTLHKYYKSSSGINFVLENLAVDDGEKKKSMEFIPEKDQEEILSQIKENYLQSQVAKKGIRKVPVITQNEREVILSDISNALATEDISITIKSRVGSEEKLKPLRSSARAYVNAGLIQEIIKEARYFVLIDQMEKQSISTDPDLLDYIEGRILVDEVEAVNLPSALFIGLIQNMNYQEKLDGNEDLYKDLTVHINNIYIRTTTKYSFYEKDIERIKPKIITLRDYFGRKGFKGDWKTEKLQLDKQAGFSTTADLILPDQLTARDVKDNLEYAILRLTEIRDDIDVSPESAKQKIAELQNLINELQKRL